MANKLPIAAFIVIVLATGVLHGLQTGRWHSSTSVREAVERLNAVPAEVGSWKGSDLTISAEELRRAGVEGWVYRRYRNENNGDTVLMLIVCGRPGPISVHTPEVCYAGSGYRALGDPQRKEIRVGASQTRSVWALRFKGPTAEAVPPIEVNWAWNAGNDWTAPDKPRWVFARDSALYKLYVIADVPSAVAAKKRDPCGDFMQTTLSVLEAALSPAKASPDS